MNKWQNLDMQELYADWAEGMQDLSLAQIDHGIKVSKTFEFPPSQGEFISYCKQYIAPEPLKIEHKLSAEQLERNRRRIREMAEMLSKNKSGGSDAH